MNKTILTILGVLTLAAMPAVAVPSGINYQAALTDDQGNPVTGTRTMSIKLYDAATGGTLLYSENIGTVDVSDGVFSFEFGTSGTSNAEQSDTVALTDGTATTFQKVVSAAEVVAGSVSVTDGTYTWSQSGGSSNEDDFGVAYSTGLRRVTVTYFNGAPAAGQTITATYRTPASGISGALAGDNQPWAEITVDGVAQIPRQKVLTVPFANVSRKALIAEKSESPAFGILAQPPVNTGTGGEGTTSGAPAAFNFYSQEVHVPQDADILKVKYSAGWSSDVWDGSRRPYALDVVVKLGGKTVHSFTFNGTSYNNNSFSFEKTVDADTLEIPRGYVTFLITATKRDYGAINGAVRLHAGSCQFWLVSEPR
jgi:hypothetical protein